MSLFDNVQTTDAKFEDLVGEGKKYKTNDDAAKAIVEKDNFIARLQAENAEMRKSMTAADRSQEILDRLEKLRNTPTAEDPPAPQVVERVVEHKGPSMDDIEKLLAERERKAQQMKNVELVKAELSKKFGSSYVDKLKSLAESTGVTTDYLEQIAATSPQALLRMVAPEPVAQPFTPPASSRQPGFTPTAGSHQKLSYYKKLQAENRAEYFKPQVQNKMYQDAMALGEEFYDVSR